MGVNASVRTCTPGPTADNSMAFVYNNNTQGLDVYLQMAGQTNVLELANERQVGSTITGSISLESVSCLRPLHIKKTHTQTDRQDTDREKHTEIVSIRLFRLLRWLSQPSHTPALSLAVNTNS